MKRIYLADDDKDIREIIKTFLLSDGYEVECFETGDDLYSRFIQQECDLIILDIMMPGTNGLDICKKIRIDSSVPIILLTAKDTDADYITGITYGSDDYIVKPFRPTLLMARIKALFRRIELEHANEEKQSENIIAGDLVFNQKKHEIFCNSNSLKLTPNEHEILIYMMKNFETAIKREDLLEIIWGECKDVETRVIDETIRKIRKKLALSGSKTSIKTVWSFGYALENL